MATPLPEPQARLLGERTDKLLARLDKEQARALIAELRKARVAVVGQLALVAIEQPNMTWQSQRLQQLLQQIDIIIADLGQRLANVILLYPERAAGIADRFAGDMLQVKVVGSFGLVNRPALVMLQEYNLSLIKRVTEDLRTEIKSVIQQGIIQGQSIPQISRQLTTDTALTKGTFPKVERRARVIARTETIRAFSQGAQWQYRQNGITRVRWMTGRDERVCEWCGPLDNLVFALDDLPFGGPPIHPQCRCMIRPVLAANQEEGNALDLEAARNVKDLQRRIAEHEAKKRKRKGAA